MTTNKNLPTDKNADYALMYNVIKNDNKPPNGPWDYEQPLKPKPKQVDISEPDMTGG